MEENRKFITLSIVFWIILNISTLLVFDDNFGRWMRFTTSAFYLIALVFIKTFDWRLFLAFLLFAICDFSVIYYEDPIFSTAAFVSRGLAFVTVSSIGFVKLKRFRISKVELLVGLLLIALNCFLLFELESMMSLQNHEQLEQLSFYIFAGITIITMIIAVSYNNRYNNKKSLFYLGTVLWMILSDLSFFIAYYLGFTEFYYPDRIFNILGSGFLALFATTTYKEKLEFF
ncbi:hypothetical protein [Zunongwangia sp. HGR-M22]|uniref:hypothetical protein n=1 Tax=Zunongwangia sp. HGR-M22 TaxID=3015168 RepID=UPI0022DE5A9E|nr:hypothetical protein [Zunongwangia sp. HGR-M22]WBL26590.1 hypothetical protein PBT91_04795 [Zunongwangia sp. HGR-M22]